jgi:hypothetical protein
MQSDPKFWMALVIATTFAATTAMAQSRKRDERPGKNESTQGNLATQGSGTVGGQGTGTGVGTGSTGQSS